MPNLFIVDGASGSGKSDFLQYCKEVDHSSQYIVKYTNKPEDGVKRPDLIYLSKEDYIQKVRENDQNCYEYTYPQGKTVKYLILKSDLDAKLKESANVFLIVRDLEIIKKIKADYSKYVNINIVTILLYSDKELTVQRAISDYKRDNPKATQTEIDDKVKERLDRDGEVIKDFTNTIGEKIYDHVILNVGSQEQFHSGVSRLINKYKDFDKHFSKLNAFIIMPFTNGWEWTHFNEVKKAIMDGAANEGFCAFRQDDKGETSRAFVSSIKESINGAVVCIADLTLSRPNCYYEIGLAEELRPRERNSEDPQSRERNSEDAIILIAQKGENVASDFNGRNIIPYTFNRGNFDDIKKCVSDQLKSFKDNHLFITDSLGKLIAKFKKDYYDNKNSTKKGKPS